MNIENASGADINMTSLSGYVVSTYEDLVNTFGLPSYKNEDPDDKVQTKWRLKINGVVATIYNWKTGVTPTAGLYNWHIGGFGKGEVDLVKQALNNLGGGQSMSESAY